MSLIKRAFNDKNRTLWFLFTLISLFKIVELGVSILEKNPEALSNGVWYSLPTSDWGDEGYVTCAENLIQNGEWMHPASGAKAPRVPGVGLIYLVFRIVASMQGALNLMMIFGVVFYAYSISKLIVYVSKSFKVALITSLLIILGDSYMTIWATVPILSEMYCIGLSVFSIYYFLKSLDTDSKKDILLSGFFLFFAFFSRVTFLPLLIVFPVLGFIKTKSYKHFYFLLPLLLIQPLWIIRTYNATGNLIWLQEIGTKHRGAYVRERLESDPNLTIAEMDLLTTEMSMLEDSTIRAFGGDWLHWPEKSAKFWLSTDQQRKDKGITYGTAGFDIAFPSYLFNEEKGLTKELMINAKEIKTKALNDSLPELERVSNMKYYLNILRRFKSYSDNNFMVKYVYRYVNLTKIWFLHNGTYQIPYSFEEASIIGKLFKLKAMLFYWVVLILGISSMLFLGFYKRILIFKPWENIPFLICLAFVSYHYVLFIIYYKACELRFNLFVCMAFLIAIIFATPQLIESLKTKRIDNSKN